MKHGEFFELHPFTRHAGDIAVPPFYVSVNGHIEFDGRRLHIVYKVTGSDLAHIVWPEPSGKPRRRDELWQHSCFECFFSRQHDSDYFEMNFSPSGDWAMYHFQEYRAFMTEPDMGERDVKIQFSADAELAQCTVDVEFGEKWRHSPSAIRADEFLPLDVGLACVIETRTAKYYFALTHVAKQPDFHQRRSFSLLIE